MRFERLYARRSERVASWRVLFERQQRVLRLHDEDCGDRQVANGTPPWIFLKWRRSSSALSPITDTATSSSGLGDERCRTRRAVMASVGLSFSNLHAYRPVMATSQGILSVRLGHSYAA